MKKVYLLLLTILFAAFTNAQTTLISPTGDGGFENGATFAANGWTVVNGATNQWFVGSVAVASAGTNSAYVSNDPAGATYNYLNTASSTVHFYRDVTFPAGETNIVLTFRWKCQGESSYDYVTVYSMPTSNTPAVNSPAGAFQSWLNIPTAYPGAVIHSTPPNLNLQTAYQTQTICLPASYAGTTRRIVFMWSNDGSAGTQPPGSVDEISLVSSLAPTTPANSATSLGLTAFSTSQINGTFTAAAGTPDGYLVVRYPAGATPTNPVNGTTYAPGNTLGTGRVVSATALTTFSATGLSPSTTYDFYVYSYNSAPCASGPLYKTTAPLTGTQTTLACGGLAAGTYTVGPTGTYASLTAVSAALAGGTTGPVIFELQGTYLSTVETFPVTFPAFVCPITGGITIRPQTGATGLSITSANATGTLLFDGASNITIDGRAGGTGPSQLTISNTTTTGYAIQLINSASFNTIRYCTVAGVNTSTTSGVIVFSNAVGLTVGNSNNTIDNCDIRDGATTPTNLIYCSGNTADLASHNRNNTISNSTIHDWFNASSTTSGAAINIVGGASDWTITANSFYQSVARTFTMTSATDQGCIFVASTTFGSNFTISNNFMGGSAPSCGGAAWTYTGGATGTPTIRMIRFSSAIDAFSNITGNTIANIAVTSSSTSTAHALISHLNGNVNINNNTIGSQSATGNITFTLAATSTAPFFVAIGAGTGASVHTINIINNNIGGITVGTSSTGAVSFRVIYAQPAVGSVLNITGNTVGGTIANSIQQLTGTATAGVGSLFGVLVLNPSIGNVITNNTVRNLTVTTTFAGPSLTGINVQASGGGHMITGNTVYNLTTNGTNVAINNAASIVGISMTGTAVGGGNISGNTIYNLTNTNTTVAGWINGMSFATAALPQPTTIVSRNFIHSINLASSTGGMAGIISLSTAPFHVINNMIRLGIDANGASITTPLQINGIYKANAGMHANFNTVYIGGTGVTSGTVNSFAYRRTSSGTSDTVMNNIFYNARSNASGTGKHYAIATNAATAFFSNYNDLLANGTGGVLGINVATDYTTLATWRTATNQDWNSVSADPILVNPIGNAGTVDLHIGAGATPVEQAGYNLAQATNDFDAQLRSGLTPVDIGADAGNFTVSDVAPPVIYLSPLLLNTCSTGDRAVNGINITDATGVPTSGVLVPRIYYRKGAGAYFSQPGTLASGTATNGIWNFNIVAADMGGLAPADVVSYYIIAQDIVGTPNIASNFGGAIATDVNTVTTHPTTPNTYTINGTSLSGNYNVGVGQTYTTLTAAIAAYNAACLTGAVTFSLTDANYAAETFPITINANLFASATNTLTIKPTLAATTITGSAATALIVLNGADWVTVNGSITATANTVCPPVTASRDLTLTNTNTATTSAVIWLQSTAAFDGATNNSIRNINLVGNGNTQTFAGVGSGSTTISTASLGALNNNNSYINNNISRTQYGIFSQGSSFAAKNNGTVINQNLVNTIAPNNTARGGILVGFENGITISGNNISEIALAGSPDIHGIALGGTAISTSTFTGNEVTNATVTKNIIGSVRNTGTFSACGIFVAPAISGTNLIANNMISGVSANATGGDFSVGMLIGGGNGSTTQIYYNTITMTSLVANPGSSEKSYALAIGGLNPVVDVRNNILLNTQNNGSGNNYAVAYGYTPFTNLTSSNNNYYTAAGATFFIGATGSLSSPTNQLTVANLQAVTAKDGNAKNVLPVFVSATDLHLSNAAGVNWCLNGTGQAVSVTDDVDCQVRNNPSDIGADEFVATGSGIATPASQTVCTGTPITTIVLSGATSYTWVRDNTVTATGIAASGTGDISGTLTNTTASPVTVTFTITAFDASGCVAPATFTATVTVNPNNTITLTSAPGTDAQTVCVNTAITNITYSTTGATGATFSGLPAGVMGSWAANVVTISGSPTTTVGSPFSYTVTLTGGCGLVTANGTITVTPDNTITLTSAPGTDAQTICVNTAITNITYSTTGATGATFSGLPAGVTGSWAANVVTISGSPTTTVGSPFSYTVTLTGGCGSVTANGTITVTPDNTITLTSAPGTDAQSVCLNSPIVNITYSTTGATGATFSGLPAGVTGSWAANVVTISGTPTTTVGTPFNYTVTLTGGCGSVAANGTITVRPLPVINSTQVEPTTCASTDGSIDITVSGAAGPYTYAWTGLGVNPTSEDQINLTVGTYSVTVTVTATGCTSTASFALAGPGGCSICPTIPSLVTSPSGAACAGSNVTFTASGLTDMGSTYGIIFKYSVAALPNPYVGGTVIATVANGALTSSGTVATANSSSIPVGSYNVYAILTPTPVDPACRPVAQTNLAIGAVPDVNQPADQVVCNNSPTVPVNFTGSVPGTVFNWTNNTPSIGLAASGTGDIASFTATNATNAPVVATVIVTPSTIGVSGTATFNYTGSLQTFTVPPGVTSINIDAFGAQGGSVSVSCAATGGLGARMRGDFAVTPGEVINIMVGQQGLTNGQDAGGGGGTFVVRGASTPLLVAGGGGGASNDINNCGGGVNRNGINASITTSGTASGNGLVAGGTAGNGGGASNGSGGGGGGFLTDGVAGSGLPGNNGKSYLNGGAGGNGNNNDFGGYGGGGAGWFTGGNGGGGGGYSGGGTSGNQPFSGGGGGGSYNAGINQVNTAGVQTGNGQVIITYVGGANCTGSPRTFTITVNPTPNAIATPASQTICSGATITTIVLTSAVSGTTYNWTRNNTATVSGIAGSGSGNISGTLTNTTTAPITVTFTITPTANGCSGATITATVLVNPTPTAVATPASQTICSGSAITPIILSGGSAGNLTVGLISSTWADEISLQLVDASSNPVVSAGPFGLGVNYTSPAVPATNGPYTFNIEALGPIQDNYADWTIYCNGNPIANGCIRGNIGPACGTATGTFSLSGITCVGGVSGTVYNWTRNNTATVTGIAASGSGNISGTLVNTTNAPITVTFTITPTANGCPGTPITATVLVNPTPNAVATPASQTVCSALPITTIVMSGNVSGTTYAWVRDNTATVTGIAASGTGNISGSLINVTAAPITVTFTITPTANGCAGAPITATVTVTPQPAATISYTGSPYCSTDLTAPVTRTGTAGGTYSAAPAGLTINPATGTVTPSTSTPGTYTVTYTIAPSGGCLVYTTTTTITITAAPNMIIFYAGTPYCSNAGTATVTRFGTAGGTYSAAPAGLTINPATGAVTLGTSTPGTYTVTYTIAPSGGCGTTITTTTITITAAPNATIAYTGNPYCSNTGTANVTITGAPTNGTFSSTAGLSLNTTTGAVNLAASTAGTYTVTYTVVASGGCAIYSTTTTITITTLPAATISYTGSPYCSNAGTATVTRTGTAGGTFSASPAGLSINAATGDVNLAASTAGVYTVTYTLAAGGGCPAVTATAIITITAAPAATISYTGNPFCQPGGIATVTRTGTAGGTYSASPAGLSINTTTGDINVTTSTPGTYTVTYTLAAGGGCPVVNATTSVTVNSLSVAPTAANTTATALCLPGTVTLSVTGGSLGSGSTWRWYSGSCGGTAVGTGASLNVTVNTTTTYFVRAEGPCNTTTCASVTVAVNVQPTITISASPRTTLLPGQTTTLTATVTPAAGNTFIWYRNGVVIPGASGSTLLVGVDGVVGTYTARVTTGAGCTALSNAVTIIAEMSSIVFVYPNPSRGQFQVRVYNQQGKQLSVLVHNARGQLVYNDRKKTSAPYTRMDVDLRSAAAGQYTVSVVDSDDQIIGTKSIIIYH